VTLRALTINPGSTSTKVALFHDRDEVFSEEISHTKERIATFTTVLDQMDFRMQAVRDCLDRHRVHADAVNAVIGRGGLLRPLPGGAFRVDEAMLDDLRSARHGEHASNLGAIIAWDLAREFGCTAYVVDTVVTDEMNELARYTGLPTVRRRSVFHALSQRGAARRAAARRGIRYSEGRFIVAHMGGGISIGAHDRGRVVDVINALDGEGPFSPERSGRLPLITVLDHLRQGRITPQALRDKVLTQGGLFAHAGTNDLREVEKKAGTDREANMLVQAMAYQISKEIASMAPALMGAPALTNVPAAQKDAKPPRVDAVVLTGGLSRSKMLTDNIRTRLRFLAPVELVTDVEEMRSMAEGLALALESGEEIPGYAPGD
jgi:butyrate kinase